ncbi:hypothetical protein Sango_2400200 [Sesamum angolense]|uniref:Reverse transcriptase/retrotransposon-derived protein RNase H-like domain-containing protein n=1 Tax=Sesamum angolense TaxID=2727404 RepID=A0AAE2BJR2_9LAMI|nr:hypothetical protein Sango_2400200 [Sesamum angolense]
MDLQPSQNNHSEEDRLQTSESLSGFFSRMTVSNKTMERIMRQDSNLSPYDGFRIGGIGKVLNQIGLNQRKHHIIYKVSSGEFAIPMEFTGKSISKFPEFSRNLLRIIGYKGKEKDLSKVLTPQEIRQLVVGRYEGMLEIAGHEFLVAGVAGRENGCMTLGLSFLEDHKPWGRKGSGICTAKPGVFPKEARETLPVIAGRDFSQKILILNTGIREAKIMIGAAFGTPWFRVKTPPIYFHDTGADILLEEIKNLKEAMQELKTMDISEKSQLSLENVKRLIQRNFSENPLAWWDRNKIEATLKIKEECKYEYVRYKPIQMNMEDKKDMQMIIKEHINLGLIEPGISAYSSPGFLVRNHGEIKKRNLHKGSRKIQKDFSATFERNGKYKWKWEEIHTQRVRELKQVCNNLPKLAIPQDEDELVVYTDANDYRWAAVLMKKTTTGKEPCRYTGGLFTEQQAQVWHINEKEFFAVWKAFKKWPLFLLAKEFTLKVDNTTLKLS